MLATLSADQRQKSEALMQTYNRFPIVFERGAGSWLFDANGKKYLDFGSGIAVTLFGHADPGLTAVLTAQAQKLWHVSNLYYTEPQLRFADLLREHTFADRVFFTNSGAEAFECALKAARRYHHANGAPERKKIISFKGAFHGRTLASTAASGTKTEDGNGTIPEDFIVLPFGDHDSLQAALRDQTVAAVALEPVQGEGGVISVPDICLQGLRKLCDENGVLLIFDEIQSGFGRTGDFFAFERSGVTPDICTTAKGIGGGFPLGACLITEKAAAGMGYGSHGSTYGGNPLGCALGVAVIERLCAPGFLQSVQEKGALLKSELEKLRSKFPNLIDEIRGRGLFAGIRLSENAPSPREFAESASAAGLIIIPASDRTVRLLPALNITKTDLREGIALLEQVLTNFAASGL